MTHQVPSCNGEHSWGDIERSRMGGQPVRRCCNAGCGFVTLDLYDEGDEYDEIGAKTLWK